MPARSDAWSALEADLRRSVRGEIRFDAGSRALYSTDASNHRQVPIGVVLPRDAEDVEALVAACRRHGAPLVGRGGGTSLAGQACNTAVVLDFSRHMAGVLEIDPERRIARVLPGTVLDDLRAQAGRHGLTFGPDPATHAWCTLGGMIGNNSCGAHSLTSGRTSDNVEELEVLTWDGLRLRAGATPEPELARIARAGGRRGEIHTRLRELRDHYAGLIRTGFPQIPRRVSGYNLDELLPERGFHLARALTGTEGTCALVLEATVRLVPAPRARALLVLGYDDVVQAAEDVPAVLEAAPIGLEGMDRFLIDNEFTRRVHADVIASLPEGGAWLLVEMGGDTPAEAAAAARRLAQGRGLLVEDAAAQRSIWTVRESAVGTTSRDPRLGDGWPGWEDAAVAPARLPSYLRDFRALLASHGYSAALYGHFGEGCIHARINFDLASEEGARRYRAFMEAAADLVVAHGGSLSGEHGDGQARGELLPRMYGEELCRAFREFKAVWDPENRMNPGKVVDARPLDADLRLRVPLARPETAFRFPEDDGRFDRAVLRCVGVGRCRRPGDHGGGVMCPSWQATREEKHSTRGRARLLFEMLAGDVLTDGWRSEEVREALDLCLSCKGCKNDCPAGVDMAAYKAEFLSHYYRGRPRPPMAWGAGRIHGWSRLAALAPGLANALLQSRPAAALLRLGGLAPERRLPRFASSTFRSRFARRPRRADGREVILWPDTFTQFFQPEIADAAVDVLEAAGWRVRLPQRDVCCGRPLYDFGLLDAARQRLRQALEVLSEEIPVVGLEPSCVSVFRDELIQLFPGDERARSLSARTFTLSELLLQGPFSPVRLGGEALVQIHCHHHSVLGTEADREVLARAGVEARILDSGCCGMAGAFGFERGHYEVSMACAERALLPAVRAAAPDTPVLADGFSCREQIAQATGRRALHLAELLRPDGAPVSTSRP
jgi:FAD/FMN-containing dehydrogenase/Fe-S oxidoreductase